MIYPGPLEIDPLQCPGGVVIHVYGVPSGTLLNESAALSSAEAAFNAGKDHDNASNRLPAGDEGYCLVAYDGDTGRRFSADEWMAGSN